MRIKGKAETRNASFISGIKGFCVLAAGILLLSACGKTEEKEKDGSSVPMESDRMESGEVETDFEYPFVAESESGYYFWERMNEEQFYPRLMFMDKESGRVVPLCNKPDCAHDSEECNARFPDLSFGEDGINKDYLQYYEGSLYAVGLSSDYYVTLFRIKADGSEWEISTKLYRTEYASTGHWRTPDLLLAEDYVYFNDHMQQKMKLERMPLGGGTSEIVFEGEDDAVEVQTYRLKESGGFVFFQALVFRGDNYEDVVGGLYRYDADAGQCSLLKSGLTGPYTVWNGTVYYANTDGICRYSIQNETTEILVDQPMEIPNITLTKDYIILCHQMENYALTFYDHEGNEAATVPNTLGMTWYFGGNSECLFGQCTDDLGLSLCFLDLTCPMQDWQWEELKGN